MNSENLISQRRSIQVDSINIAVCFMQTNLGLICFELLETTMCMRYSLLEPILVNLRDAPLVKLDALVAILDHNRAKVDQERSTPKFSCASIYSSMLQSPLTYSST